MPKLRRNKRSAYILVERPTPPSSKSRHYFETTTCLEENRSLDHGCREIEAYNYCAGEDQQQFNRPTGPYIGKNATVR
jgi:hypothetical protein